MLKEDSISIEIEDDGDGFDPGSVPTPGRLSARRDGTAGQPVDGKRGLGLMGMRERVDLLGGTIDIDAAPGQGVRIAVTVPLKREPTYV